MSEWIDINDRLPEECVDVLVYEPGVKYQTVWIGQLLFKCGVWSKATEEHEFRNNPTHWMPLPEPPGGAT